MNKNTRWVFLGFLGMGLLLAWILGESFKSLIFYTREFTSTVADTQYGFVNAALRNLRNFRDIRLLGDAFTLANLMGVLGAFLIAMWAWRKENVNDFSHEVVEELRKVTWPDADDTRVSTIVVIVTTIVIATMLWIFDFVWSWGTGLIYSAG